MTSPTGPDPKSAPHATLGEQDAAALEALLAAGLDLNAVPAPMRARAQRVGVYLDLLDTPAPSAIDRESLVASVLARFADLRRTDSGLDLSASDGWVSESSALSPADQDAFDALVAAGFDAGRVPSALRARAERQRALLSLLDVPTSSGLANADGRESLVARTLAHVQGEIDSESERYEFAGAKERRRGLMGGWQLADLMGVAAVLLIGGAVLTPMLDQARASQRRLACESNLRTAGAAFAAYATDHRDAMPMASASLAGNPWWLVGDPERSNSSNLFTLPRAGYTTLESLDCPGNRFRTAPSSLAGRSTQVAGVAVDWSGLGQISYSLQNLFAENRRSWSGGRERVEMLTDRSPVVLRAVRRQVIYTLENSPNHRGEGQHTLYNDGSVTWLTTPVSARGDNLWLPRSIEQTLARAADPAKARPLEGTEQPTATDDSFMVP